MSCPPAAATGDTSLHSNGGSGGGGRSMTAEHTPGRCSKRSGHRPPPLKITIPTPEVLAREKSLSAAAAAAAGDSPTSPRGRRPEIMGALYEDVEKFFGDIFACYGRTVARQPVPFVVLPLVVCGLLGLGLFQLQYETNVETLYTPVDSDALKDQTRLRTLFPDYVADDFYQHQPLSHGTYGEIILTLQTQHDDNGGSENELNIVNTTSLEELKMTMGYIHNISVKRGGKSYTFADICARRNGSCVIEGAEVVDSLSWSHVHLCYRIETEKVHSFFINDTDRNVVVSQTIAGFRKRPNDECVFGTAIRVRFYLNENKRHYNRISLAWQTRFLEEMGRLQGVGVVDVTEVHYSVSEALDLELNSDVGRDLRYLVVSIITMLLYATIQGGGGDCVSNHVTLAYAGVFAALLSITAAYGFLALCGLRFVNMSGVMPFLVIGIGVDDMFQLMTEWRQTNLRDSLEARMGSTLRGAAVSITITSLTDLLAFCIGATSPFVSVKHFCATSGIAILFCYINQLTFFSGVIVLHARRVHDDRHCLTCLKTRSRDEMEEDHTAQCLILACSGQSPQKFGDEGGLCRTISRLLYTTYPWFILHWITKCFVIVLIGVYVGLSMWGASMLQNGFEVEDIISSDSNLHRFLQLESDYYPKSGPAVMFVVENPVLYYKSEVQTAIETTLEGARAHVHTLHGGFVSWLDDYKRYLVVNDVSAFKNEAEFVSHLRQSFVEDFPQYRNDIRFGSDNKTIAASRFYVMCTKLADSAAEAELMQEMRQLANDSPINITAFSTDFLYYEHYVCILKNTLLAVGVAVIGMLFVALVFIPHPIAVSCVTISMVSVVLGMVGFMTFWGLALSAITTIQIILSVGICVDSTVHISHAFMTATGKNRNERVSVALEKVGIPILNGAISSLLGILMLALGSSYMFISFFKTMFLVVVLGLLHSLVFLPVMLSFIGPRRTSKPRVFIPVSPSSRSLQDMYRANSMCRPEPPSQPAPIVISKMMDYPIPPALKTQSLTDIHTKSMESPVVFVKEPRRVSFAVGDESKFKIDKSFLETKVDKSLFGGNRLMCDMMIEEEETVEAEDDKCSVAEGGMNCDDTLDEDEGRDSFEQTRLLPAKVNGKAHMYSISEYSDVNNQLLCDECRQNAVCDSSV